LLLSDDVHLIPRLQEAVRASGLAPVLLDAARLLGAADRAAARPVPITEPLEGSDARFLRGVVELQPALIVFDLASAVHPWERWIQVLGTSAATLRIPVLAYAAPAAADAMARALALGARHALPQEIFLDTLPGLLATLVPPARADTAEAGCRGPLDPAAAEGLLLVRRGHYFAAHESLEAAVLRTRGPESGLYRLLLQLSVAYLQLERGNLRGARKMLLRLRRWLHPLPDACRGVDVARLRAQIAELQAAVDAAAEDPSQAMPAGLLRPIPLLAEDDHTT
jgi:hypothetical protein